MLIRSNTFPYKTILMINRNLGSLHKSEARNETQEIYLQLANQASLANQDKLTSATIP